MCRRIQCRDDRNREVAVHHCRQRLVEIPKLGRKVFEQAAGFQRICDGRQPLDNSAVHPENYHVVEKMAAKLGIATSQLVGNAILAA